MKRMRWVARFRPGWKMSLFVAATLPVLVALGFWQLERASYKAGLEDAWLVSTGALPIDAADFHVVESVRDAGDFVRIRLTGTYDLERQFLVDNRTHRGAVGYDVVTPMSTEAGTFFVNRGWVGAGPSRAQLPHPMPPAGRITVVGMIWPDTGRLPVLGADDWNESWPKRVQRLDFGRMAAMIGAGHPVQVRLEDGQPGALTVARRVVDFGAVRHIGYAVQWFGLALVLATGFVYFATRGGHRETRT
jgi:surfeit locus 1 family protein